MLTRRRVGPTLAAALAATPAIAQTAIHPAEDYRRAANLFRSGRRDEAVYWLYRGQYRYRVHLAARPGLARDGDPALFASLSESVGRPINEYAFGDLPALLAILDRVIAEARAEDDGFTPKAQFPGAHRGTLAGLAALRDQIDWSRDAIRAQRLRNGLSNRN
ncbi:MAG: hypothetical protein BGP06_18155 [Rhizobiales bacterium 65-9]|nr:hypothetical protein [Hyphomicrobiales bacterium]OJY34759.1 MAG: hypothetical protein BGP06_18155 [Rhizobiales bacterium 65-9]